MRVNTAPENSTPITITPVLIIPVKDFFITYAVAAVCVSAPFLLLLAPDTLELLMIPVWHTILYSPALDLGIILLLLISFLRGKKMTIKFPVVGLMGTKVIWITETTLKSLFLAYGLIPIIFALLSTTDIPCENRAGYNLAISFFFVHCVQAGTVLLGFSMSGSLILSTLFLKSNIQRWRLLRWSLLVWLVLGIGVVISMLRECPSPCVNFDACYRMLD